MITQAQRATVRALLREAEFDLQRVTLLHTRVPHCPRPMVGQQVEAWLDGLTPAQASDVIRWLQREVA